MSDLYENLDLRRRKAYDHYMTFPKIIPYRCPVCQEKIKRSQRFQYQLTHDNQLIHTECVETYFYGKKTYNSVSI